MGNRMDNIEKKSKYWPPYIWAPAIACIALTNLVGAQDSNITLPVHGHKPNTPTNITISANNGVASVTNSAYLDVDGDILDTWSYQWSHTKSDGNIASTRATYNLTPGQEIFVRVASLSKTGFPDSTRVSNWSEWSPGYKVDADIFTFGTCNSNNFIYSNKIKAQADVFIGRIYLNDLIIGNENNSIDVRDTTTVALDKPIRRFNIWQATNRLIGASPHFLEYTEIVYMDNSRARIANSSNRPGTESFKVDVRQIPGTFSLSGRYVNGARVVAIAACNSNYPTIPWQGYTGIRFALTPA